MHANSKLMPPDGLYAEAFWSLFDGSAIPMALVDRNRRYVRVNDAVMRLFQYPHAKVIGSRAGWSVVGGDSSTSDAEWQELLRTNELCGERVVTHANGSPMRVSYAAHATTVSNKWIALFVTLSARFSDGPELVGRARANDAGANGCKLTARERQVVEMVALGLNTRRIAEQLSLSPDTVRSHVRNSMAKTGAHTRAQLVALVLADRPDFAL